MTTQRTPIEYEDIEPGDLIEVLLTGRPDHGDLTHHAQIVNHTGFSFYDEPAKGIVFEPFASRFHHSEYAVYTKITTLPSEEGSYIFLEETSIHDNFRENTLAELVIVREDHFWYFLNSRRYGEFVTPEQITKWRPATVTSP